MDVQVEEKSDVVIVRLSGRLDAASSAQVEQRLNGIVDAGHFKLVLNFADVDYLSSAGMRLMLAVLKKLKSLEGKVVVCDMAPEVLEVVKMTGFHHVIEIYNSEQEACTHL